MVLIRSTAAAVLLALPPAAALADESTETDGQTTIWDSVFTEDQAQRGEAVYPAVCGRCHGYKLDGAPDDPDMLPAPPIAGPKFLRKWTGASLATLFEYTRTTMPAINPSSLSDQEFVDLVAYTLSVSGAPPGSMELKPEVGTLYGIMIASPR